MSDVKTIKMGKKKYYGWLVYSPDDGGYYVEIFEADIPGCLQTGINDTPQKAWDEAREIIRMTL